MGSDLSIYELTRGLGLECALSPVIDAENFNGENEYELSVYLRRFETYRPDIGGYPDYDEESQLKFHFDR